MQIDSGGDAGPLLFVRKFLREGTRVASVAPSSRALARAMCEHVSPDRPQTILELGAGTGAVTKYAAAKMHPDSRLIAVEIDEEFAAVLGRAVPRAEVIVGDVAALDEALDAAGVGEIDVVLSGLPTPSLPRAVNAAVLELFEKRAEVDEGAVFSQLTVMPWVYRGMYRKVFDDVAFRLVMRNVPPGGAYHCRGLRPDWRERVPGKGPITACPCS